MQRSAFESFHPWVIFGYLAAVLAVTMSTMHPVMIVTSFVISLVYSLFLCGRVVWKRSVMTGLGVSVFSLWESCRYFDITVQRHCFTSTTWQ